MNMRSFPVSGFRPVTEAVPGSLPEGLCAHIGKWKKEVAAPRKYSPSWIERCAQVLVIYGGERFSLMPELFGITGAELLLLYSEVMEKDLGDDPFCTWSFYYGFID